MTVLAVSLVVASLLIMLAVAGIALMLLNEAGREVMSRLEFPARPSRQSAAQGSGREITPAPAADGRGDEPAAG